MQRVLFCTLALLALFATSFSVADPFVTLDNQAWFHNFRTSLYNEAVTLTGVCHDLVGDVYATGYTRGPFENHQTTNMAALVFKFTSNGTRLWTRIEDGSSEEVFSSCVTDGTGAVIVTGYTYSSLGVESDGSVSGKDIVLFKYSAGGDTLISKQIGFQYSDTGLDVSVDASNNIYIFAMSPTNYWESQLLKYSPTGEQLWHKNGFGFQDTQYVGFDNDPYVDSTNTFSYSNGVRYGLGGRNLACNSAGECYLSFATWVYEGNYDFEYYGNSRGGRDIVLMKFDSEGNIMWRAVHGSSSDDFVFAVTLDVFGNVWIAGAAGGALEGNRFFGGSYDSFVTKYSPNGQRLFSRVFGTAQFQLAFSLAGDATGAMYILTNQYNSDSSTSLTRYLDGVPLNWYLYRAFTYVTKMDSFGNRIWSKALASGTTGSHNSNGPHLNAYDIAVRPTGELVVVGTFNGVFNEASSPASNVNIRAGFIVASSADGECQAENYDSLMTEINDLLNTLGVN